MKIAIIHSIIDKGSISRIVICCYSGFSKQGNECTIAYGRGTPPKGVNAYKIGTKLSLFTHLIITRLFDACGYGSKIATKRLLSFFDEYKPDIVHIHNLHGYYINVFELFQYFKMKEIPVVWTLHDCWSFTGHCPYYTLANCNKWKSYCHKCPETHDYPRSFIFDNSRNNFLKKKECFSGVKNLVLVTPSQWLAREVMKSYLREYRVEVIHNGVDQSIFFPRRTSIFEKYGLGMKHIILGIAINWSYGKGLDVFERLAEVIDEQYQIVLVGLSRKQIKKTHPKIIGIEYVENTEELSEYYSAASVFVNPTRSDNFPTTNIEALSCGTPVITFSGTGSQEAIDQETGIVVDKDDIDGIVSAIQKLCKKKNIEEVCVKNARKYNADYVSNEYLKLFIEMMSKQ